MKRWSKDKRPLCIHQNVTNKTCHENCIYYIEDNGLMGCMLVDKTELEIFKLVPKQMGRPKKGDKCSEGGKPSL